MIFRDPSVFDSRKPISFDKIKIVFDSRKPISFDKIKMVFDSRKPISFDKIKIVSYRRKGMMGETKIFFDIAGLKTNR